jgi:single-strand DNA-binding protein
MFNKVFIIGNLTKDPDLRYTPSGIPVARFTVAVNRYQKKGEQKNAADFINCVAWRRLAEICGEYLKKGRPVAVEGRLQIRTFEQGGEQRTTAEVLADNMQMLGRKPETQPAHEPEISGGEPETEEHLPSEEEIPF